MKLECTELLLEWARGLVGWSRMTLGFGSEHLRELLSAEMGEAAGVSVPDLGLLLLFFVFYWGWH